jgi:hypothetical protein
MAVRNDAMDGDKDVGIDYICHRLIIFSQIAMYLG